jgi:hypothetical protein
VIGGSVESTDSGTSAPAASAPAPDPDPAPAPSERTKTFSGRGDAVITITLLEGLTLIDASHRGSSNFVVWLRGSSDDLLVNEIGRYTGTRAAGVGGGTFLLDVEADGAWDLVVREPRNQPPSAERVFSGASSGMIDFLALDGLHTIAASHRGRSNFVVWLYDESGNQLDLIVNEIGAYEGTNAVRVSDGIYLLVVEADGAWGVRVQ